MERFADLARSAAAVATGQLGWLPQQFWDSTVPELRTALEGRAGRGELAPLGRAELDELEKKVPQDGR
jgi:hypothetical protein